MKDEIQKIRELLDHLENASSVDEERSFRDSFELFELPEIVASIVDYLQPVLLPYEAAIYWFMFRHSVVETGDVYARVSVRGLAGTVITSRSGLSQDLSYKAVRGALDGLEEKGAIAKAGDTNQEGTLYVVRLPEEIEICCERMAERQAADLPKIDPKRELDYYNIKENRKKVFERDGYKCRYCDKQLTRFSATLDHAQPVSEGGDNSYENLTTACLHCNSGRGARPVMDWIAAKTAVDE
ncbi:MAG: HNH endonuclease [Planctomycetota bacterium]|jgi:hypothetical protein